MLKNVLLVFLVSFLSACGGGETTVESDSSSVDISPLNGHDGVDGVDGLTPIFNREEFYNSEGQNCVRLSIGYDTVYENGMLDMGTEEVEISDTNCEDEHTEILGTGLIFTYNIDAMSEDSEYRRITVRFSDPVAEFSMSNLYISDVTFIRITGIFKRPRPDGLVTVHFLKSELQCLVGDQDPRHIGTDTYSVLCPAYGAYIPANEKVKVVWQFGPRRNSFELKKVEVFGYLSRI